MRRLLLPLLLLFVVISSWAQTPATAAVPPLVKFSGTLANTQGTVGVIFALYAEQTGGAPLWLETQNVTPDANGRYTVYLGANHANGVPPDIFAAAEARWLGVQPEGQAEMPRVQLVSVPYALKAADATTLGGQPLSAFVLASGANGGTTTTSGSTTTPATTGSTGVLALSSPQAGVGVTTSGSAVTNYLAKFTDTANVESSSFLAEGSLGIGIGTTNPMAALHVVSGAPSTFFDSYSGSPSTILGALPMVNRAARGTLASPSAMRAGDYLGGLGARGYGATKFTNGWRAAILLMADQDWTDTAQGTKIAFGVTANDTASQSWAMTLTGLGQLGIGTYTPSALLEVNGTAKFDGLVTFAPGQTFPGANSSVTTNYPLSGDGSSGSPLSISQAGPAQSGYLSGSDWSNFNNKLSFVSTSSGLNGNGSFGSPLGLNLNVNAPLSGNGGSSPLSLTGTVGTFNGGTGLSFVGTSGSFLRSNGASLSYSPIGFSDLPSLNNVYVDLVSPQMIGGSKTFTAPTTFNVGTSFQNALQAEADAGGAFAIQGQTQATDSQAAGVVGLAMANGTSSALGVLGNANGSNGIGVAGHANGSNGVGVDGSASGTGNPIGVMGFISSASGAAGVFQNNTGGGDILRAVYNGATVFKVKTSGSGFPSAVLPPYGTPVSGSTGGVSSSYLSFSAGVLDPNGTTVHNPKLLWRADPINNNATGYNAKLVFYSGMDSGNATATSLWINADGTINFPSNQTFPGSNGTITGVTTASGSGLAGGGTTGTLNLSLLGSCTAGQLLKWSGSAWGCADDLVDTGGVTGNGYLPLSGGAMTGSLNGTMASFTAATTPPGDNPPAPTPSPVVVVTQTGDGPAPPNGTPTLAFMQSIPAAIYGNATTTNGIAVGVVGNSTGGVGVVGLSQSPGAPQ